MLREAFVGLVALSRSISGSPEMQNQISISCEPDNKNSYSYLYTRPVPLIDYQRLLGLQEVYTDTENFFGHIRQVRPLRSSITVPGATIESDPRSSTVTITKDDGTISPNVNITSIKNGKERYSVASDHTKVEIVAYCENP